MRTSTLTFRDLGIIGLFFAAQVILRSIPFSGIVLMVLFPICAMFLSFKRAVALMLLTVTFSLAGEAFSNHFLGFTISLAFMLFFVLGEVIAIWMFKHFQNMVPLALILYCVFGFAVPIGLLFALMAMMILFWPSLVIVLIELSGVKAAILGLVECMKNPLFVSFSQSLSTAISEMPEESLMLVGKGFGILLVLGLIIYPTASFATQCWILRSIQRRTRGLPKVFPT